MMAADTYHDHPGRQINLFRLWCEWDIGHEDVVFTSQHAAYAWLAENATVQGMIGPDEDFANVQEIFDSGLMGFIDLEVVE